MSKSEVNVPTLDEALQEALNQCGGEEATIFLCRGNYEDCRAHLQGRRKRGEPSCQWCAVIDVTAETTIDDMRRAARLDS